MSLYEDHKIALERLYREIIRDTMKESDFYDKTKKKFEDLEQKIEGLDKNNALRKIKKSLINRILKVYNRVLLIRDLNAQLNNAKNQLQVYMYPGLITYLYLTCFDQLGQPYDGWYFFPNWINSKSKVSEVDEIIAEAKDNIKGDNADDAKRLIKYVYDRYHEIYGVRNSFYRFIRKIIPDEIRRNLLDSILVEQFSKDGNKIDGFQVDDLFKEKWLYNTRNNYTHNLFTVETNVAPGKREGINTWLLREEIHSSDNVVVIWVLEDFNSILESSIITAIRKLIEKE